MSTLPLITGLVLAGGQSRRMGRNKALLELNGETLINHALKRLRPQVTQLLISTNTGLPTAPEGSDIPQLADTIEDAGPLGGILTGLKWVDKHQNSEWLLTVAVDTPYFPKDLANQLWQAKRSGDLIIAARSNAKAHPTFALWHTKLLKRLSHFVAEDEKRRLMGFIEQQPHQYVSFDAIPMDPFSNLNTPQDFAELTRR